MNYCHWTGLKNKNGSLRLHGGFFSIQKRTSYKLECTCIFCHITSALPCSNLNGTVHIFSGKPEMSMNFSTSMRNNTYLLTLQANCATFWWEKCDHSWLALTILSFCKKACQKCWPIRTCFQNKTKQARCIKVGNGPLKARVSFPKKQMLQKLVLNLLWTPNDLDDLFETLCYTYSSGTSWFQLSCYCHAKLNS